MTTIVPPMHIDQEPYRALYDSILSYDGSGLPEDVVRPWMRAAKPIKGRVTA